MENAMILLQFPFLYLKPTERMFVLSKYVVIWRDTSTHSIYVSNLPIGNLFSILKSSGKGGN